MDGRPERYPLMAGDLTETLINGAVGLVGALIGGGATMLAAKYAFEKQNAAETARRAEERRQTQLAHDHDLTRLFNSHILGIKYTDDVMVIYDHLRSLRRLMIEHPDLFLEIDKDNQEYYGHHLAPLPADAGRTMQDNLFRAKREIDMLKHPDVPKD
jgi:hypothetical protein